MPSADKTKKEEKYILKIILILFSSYLSTSYRILIDGWRRENRKWTSRKVVQKEHTDKNENSYISQNVKNCIWNTLARYRRNITYNGLLWRKAKEIGLCFPFTALIKKYCYVGILRSPQRFSEFKKKITVWGDIRWSKPRYPISALCLCSKGILAFA